MDVTCLVSAAGLWGGHHENAELQSEVYFNTYPCDFDKCLSVRQAAQMLHLLARAIGDIRWSFHPKQGVNAPPTPARTCDIITFQTLSRVL